MTQTELLDRLEADVRALLETVRTRIVPLDDQTLRQRPSPERWNMLECFAHLNVFSDMYLPRMELAIHKAKARRWAPAAELKYKWPGSSAIKKANPANTKARKTHKRYNFIGQELPGSTVKSFIINCEMLLRVIQASREVDLNRAKVARGKSGFFSYTLGNVLEWLVVHNQRHIFKMSDE